MNQGQRGMTMYIKKAPFYIELFKSLWYQNIIFIKYLPGVSVLLVLFFEGFGVPFDGILNWYILI